MAWATRERKNEYQREWRKKNKRQVRTHNLTRDYGITADGFDRLLLAQGGGCATCGKTSKLCVEHDHRTGKIRGIVCRECNLILGLADDSIAVLTNCINYLRKSEL